MIVMSQVKKIAYVSGTRADFGLMSGVLTAINESSRLKLELYATGMHLMPQFGDTVNIVKQQFPQTKIVNAIFTADSKSAVVKFNIKFMRELNNMFEKNRPDFVLTLGDRPEMLCVAIICLYLGIPTGQLHAGDKTATVDETARHAITKLSQLHFPATNEAATRIEKMGEEKWRIHVVGAPALDTIFHGTLPNKKDLYQFIKIPLSQKIILLTQHPVTEEIKQAALQIKETIEAVRKFKFPVVVVYPSADPGGRSMIRVIEKEKKNSQFHIFSSIEYTMFLALAREAKVWVGNSSAGIIESPSFATPVVNIGLRQKGRLRAKNIIDVNGQHDEIEAAINKCLFDEKFKRQIKKIKNPWGDGQTGKRIVKILENVKIDSKLIYKQITY